MPIQPRVWAPVLERMSRKEGDAFMPCVDSVDTDYSHWTWDPVTVALTHIVYAER